MTSRSSRFPGTSSEGDIGPAIRKLVDDGTIRVIDAAFVTKDSDGDTAAVEVTQLDPDVVEALADAGLVVGGLFNDDDLMGVAAALEPDSSAAVLVWENVWARSVAQAMRDAGGMLVAFERVPHEVVQTAREWALEQAEV